MIFHSHAARLIGVALTLVGIGAGVPKAIAQTTYEFNTSYDTEVTLTPIPGSDISEVFVLGTNPDAPYGLTTFTSDNYSRLDPSTGIATFGPDAAAFGLEGLPIGQDVFFSSEGDRLLGSSNATATFDFQNLTVSGSGTVNITGGAGRFAGATGTLTFTENDALNPDPNVLSTRGEAFLSGSFETPEAVPEPKTEATLAVVGAIGASFLLRRQRQRTM